MEAIYAAQETLPRITGGGFRREKSSHEPGWNYNVYRPDSRNAARMVDRYSLIRFRGSTQQIGRVLKSLSVAFQLKRKIRGGLLSKPEYVFNPRALLSRLRWSETRKHQFVDVLLPWGVLIRARPSDTIGRALATFGIYDLTALETISRLLEPGETAIDVGANIGCMTSLMAWRVGSRGKVISFEPCSSVHAELIENAARWTGTTLCIRQEALSDSAGEAVLNIPELFSGNRGTASLEPQANTLSSETVRTERLDNIVGAESIGLMKIDVEGHEYACLKGASEMLSGGRCRDILFEESGTYPTASQILLQSFGYSVFRLSRSFWGPTLCAPESNRSNIRSILANCLATREPKRAHERLKPHGWTVLHP